MATDNHFDCDFTDECRCADCEAMDYTELSEDNLYDNYNPED